MKIAEAIKELDNIFFKYGIKDEKNVLGYKNNFIEYVKGLEGVSLEEEYKKRAFFYEFIELQKKVGLEVDLLNNYTMLLAISNRKLGQDFTPISLSEMLSKITINEEVENPIFYDAAGGTGTLIIQAYYEWLYKQKHFDDQFRPILEIDEFDIYNCYCCVFNFIIRGLNAIVRNKDTLTNETYAVFVMTNRATTGEIFSWYSDYKTIPEEEIQEW